MKSTTTKANSIIKMAQCYFALVVVLISVGSVPELRRSSTGEIEVAKKVGRGFTGINADRKENKEVANFCCSSF